MTLELLDALVTLGALRFKDLEPTGRPLLLRLFHNVDASKFVDCCDIILSEAYFQEYYLKTKYDEINYQLFDL